MAGHYFYDPRPFYGHTGYSGLIPLDELFYGRYETIPYWMDQRMMPVEESYYPGHKSMMGSRRGAEVMQQQCIPQRGENNFMAYTRPELVRDDMYADMYRRSPYNFNYNHGRDGVTTTPMYPQGQSQDDTWVHSMNAAPAPSGYGQGYRGLPEPPPGAIIPHFGNGNGNYHYRSGDQYRQTESHTMSKQSNMNNRDNHGNTKQMSSLSGNPNGNVGKALARAGATNTTLKRTSSSSNNNTKRYDSSASSDSEEEDGYDSHKRGGRPSVKSWNSHGYETKNSSHSPSSYKPSSNKLSSNKKSRGSHTRSKSQSKISKLLGFYDGGGDDSSSSEDESYGYSKKRSSSGNTTHASGFQPQYVAQPKHTQLSSQSKYVELRVPICCDNCEQKVRACLAKMQGVENVLCDQWKRKVIVYGKVKAEDVLKRVRRVKKTSELWQQAKLPQQQLGFY